MAEHRQIDIDLDVHKRIELEKRSFSESDNEVLRRLLGIDSTQSLIGRAWSGKGVSLPHGTEIQMEYNGRQHQGRIDEGNWLVEGNSFSSPSAAAGGVALTKAGNHPSLDGWMYWHVKRPDDNKWVPLKRLRQQAT
ncbi:MAG: hypothetical protein ACTS10_20225 [Kiloniellales bacterium]